MDLVSIGMDTSALGGNEAFKYPDMPEFSLRELLLLEKENSGMYFSGHMIDSYSHHISTLKTDNISDIYSAFELSDDDGAYVAYKDGTYVKICGIIMSKSTKTLKNGDTMAFIVLEGDSGEIEVVVFAKQYARYKDELEVEGGIAVEGRLSIDENDSPKLLLSKLERLMTNTEFDILKSSRQPKGEEQSLRENARVFIKVQDLSDRIISPIYRLSSLNPGACSVILYDSQSGKYTKMKNVTISDSDDVISRLESRFGKGNVVVKQ
jgi:DNA polymerase-3 subunit alpha